MHLLTFLEQSAGRTFPDSRLMVSACDHHFTKWAMWRLSYRSHRMRFCRGLDQPLNFHPAATCDRLVLIRSATLDRPKAEFSGFAQGNGLVTPPDFVSRIGPLVPIAPCGRSSHDPLQPSVLVLERLQPLHLARQQPGILLLPLEAGRGAACRPMDPSLAADLGHRRAFLVLLDDERLLRVREIRCRHSDTVPLPARKAERKTPDSNGPVCGDQIRPIAASRENAYAAGRHPRSSHLSLGAAKRADECLCCGVKPWSRTMSQVRFWHRSEGSRCA
jgi:hypothetical protein